MQEVDDICDRIAIVDKGKVIAMGTGEELKALVSDKSVYNLTVSKRIKGLEDKLTEITGVKSVLFADDKYKITTLKSSNIITKLVEVVSANGGDIINISNEEPTLEMVFLALTGKKLRE